MPAPSKRLQNFGLFAPFALFGLVATLFAIYTTLEIKHRQIEDSLAGLGRTSVEALTLTMSRSSASEIEALVGQTRDVTGPALARHPAVIAAHERLSHTTNGTNILKIKIFDVDGRTLYSPTVREIGVPTAHPSAVPDALAGRSTTIVYPPRSVDGFGGVRHLDSVVATYAPVRGADGVVTAVFEVYVDTSLERANIEANLRRFDTTIGAVLLALYVTLLALGWRVTRAQLRQRDALSAERARFADFSDVAAGWVWETDADHRLTFTSAGIRATGIEPSSRYGQRSRAWNDPTGVDHDGPSLGSIMEAKREFRDIHVLIHMPDGRELWFARSARPVFDAAGAFLGYRGADRDVTGRVNAERELRAADATKSRLLDALDRARMGLELAVETAQMGWWEIDGETGEQYWSPRAREIWGVDRDTPATFENFLAAMHPDDARGWDDSATLAQGTLVRHYRVRNAGGIRYVRQHTRVERLSDGMLLRVTGSVIDVTDTEDLRATAERAKAVLESALDAMRDGFVLFDAEERLVTLNKAYLSFRPGLADVLVPGTSAEAINDAAYARNVSNAADPETRRAMAEARLKAFRNPGAPFEMVFADGRIAEVVDTRTEAGYTVSITRDVTQERRAAAELARAKAVLDNALESMADGFALFDSDDRVITVNAAYRRMLPGAGSVAEPGTKFERLIRKGIDDALPDGTPSEREKLIQWRLAYHRDPKGKIEFTLGTGATIEISETRTPGGLTATVTRDVTEERRAAAELARAKVAAEHANRAKSRFLATMSHEIRTPMNGVLGTIELLAGTPLDGRQRTYVEAVDRSASALLSILDDILDYSKLEAGDLKVEDIAFDPASVLRQTAALMAPGAEKKGLQIGCRVGADIPESVAGDPTRVRQVLFNLMGNAIKFTERGRVDATLERHGDKIAFSVTDTGIGIEAAALPRLFDRFSQADETIARRFGGTGLGLAIARDLARAMGGDIDVTSAPGTGSTFALRLPIREAAAPPAPISAPAAAPLPARPLDLLVAEDNEINRMVVHDLLERMGHKVAFAIDGREAIARARDKRYDAILMDAQMPEIDGVEATRWIRIMPEPFGSVPIVALTANAMRGDREAYLAVGMNDYLAKPVNGGELARALERVTGIAARAPATRVAAPAVPAANEGLAALVANLRAGRGAQ